MGQSGKASWKWCHLRGDLLGGAVREGFLEVAPSEGGSAGKGGGEGNEHHRQGCCRRGPGGRRINRKFKHVRLKRSEGDTVERQVEGLGLCVAGGGGGGGSLEAFEQGGGRTEATLLIRLSGGELQEVRKTVTGLGRRSPINSAILLSASRVC